MTGYSTYMICTAPRSGSTLLCSLLSATGVAGKPASWFYESSVADWQERLAVQPAADKTEAEALNVVFQAAIRAGAGGKRVFGLRQQAESFRFLFEKLAVLVPDARTDLARFEAVFGKTLFIHLTRSDKVEQAASYLRAEQTGLWHLAADGSELERLAPHREPVFDAARIGALIQLLTDYDRIWADWFLRQGITPLVLAYDDLARDPSGPVRRVLDALGLDPSAADAVIPGVRKLADGSSRDWVARYRAKQGRG
jgi:trehalose 2-sulfotransferase